MTRQRVRKLPPQTESALSRQVAAFLDWALPPGSVFTHIASGGKRPRATAGRLNAEGVRKGAPDFVIVAPVRGHRAHENRVIWVELKREGKTGTLRPDQERWRDAILAAGEPWFLCSTLDEVIALLTACGVPLRHRAERAPIGL